MINTIPVTDHVFNVFKDVTGRIAKLQNSLCDKDQSVSFTVEWSSRPNSIYIHIYLWDEKSGITYSESAHWDYDIHADDESALYGALEKWEEAYGLQ